MEPNEGAAEQAQDTQEQGGGTQDAMQMVDQLGQSISGFAQSMQKVGAPPEAVKAFAGASDLFQQGVAILTGKGQAPAPGNMDTNEAAGAKPANF